MYLALIADASWDAIKNVSSGFSLCAFIVAALFSYLKRREVEKRKRIEAAPEQDRAQLVTSTLEFFNVDTTGLTRQQQFDLAMLQIQARIERFRIVALVVVILALLGVGTYAYALNVEKPTGDKSFADRNSRGGPVIFAQGDVPPEVQNGSGAPVGITFRWRFLRLNVECFKEDVKLSETRWVERVSSDSQQGCNSGDDTFNYSERESEDPQNFLLYDEGRNLLARLPRIVVGETGLSAWRQLPSQTWNQGRVLTRVK